MITRTWLQNASLGDAIAAMPWFYNGLSNDDFGFLISLLKFAARPNVQPELLTAAFTSMESGDLRDHLLSSLGDFAVSSLRDVTASKPVTFDEVASLPWVVDGLGSEEAAFLVSLSALATIYPWSSALPELQNNYFVQSESISLPLASEVRVWVFQNVPFAQNEDLAGFITHSISIMEDLLGTPFPTTDVILLIVEDDSGYLVSGANYSHSMWITKADLDMPLVAHETAHYYFSAEPHWLQEGAPDFMASYIAYKTGSQGLSEWRNALLSKPRWTHCTSNSKFANLLHLSYHGPDPCSYVMGEHFLLNVMEAIGKESLGAALGELSLSGDRWNSVSEQQIYDALLKHTRPESREAFLDVYERLHGGPALPDISDDHGDNRASATPLSVGQPVTGVLDYRFDLDFFSFRAEQGQEYLLRVRHSTLRPSSLGLYPAEGGSLARGVEQVTSGLQMRWTAPSTGEYYVSVENFAGETGTYTLTVESQ